MLSGLGKALEVALSASYCSRIHIGRSATVVVFPVERRYTSDLSGLADAEELMRIEMEAIPDHQAVPVPAGALSTNQLAWQVALQLQRCHLGAVHVSTGLLKLVTWPNLAELPTEIVAPTARLCALLWRKPTAAHLVVRTLDAAPDETALLLRLLLSFGHIQLLTPSALATTPALAAEPEHDDRLAARGSLLGRLWRRLSSR